MPTETLRRGKLRWRAVVKIECRIVASKWFGSGPKERRAAILWEEAWKREMARGRTSSPEPAPLAWSVAYLEKARLRYAKKTYWEKKTALDKLMVHVEGLRLSQITPGVAEDFLAGEARARSGNVANRDRKNLATAWGWGRRFMDGFPKEEENPFQAVETFAEQRKPRYVPPQEDFWAVLGLAQGQDRVMLLAYLYTAARKDELFRLKWEDLDFRRNRVRLYTKKTRDGSWRADWLPLLPELKPALQWWEEARPYKASEHVFVCLDDSPSPNHKPGERFVSRQHFMPRMCARAEVKPFGLHAIRHLRAVMLYEGGARLHEIQQWLRHESAGTTERYLKSLGLDINGLAEAAINAGRAGKVIPFAPVNGRTPGGISSEGSGYPPVYPPAVQTATRS